MKDIVFVSDENFAPHLATVIASLCQHNTAARLHVISNGISKNAQEQITRLVAKTPANKLNFYPIDNQRIKQLMAIETKHEQELTVFCPLLLDRILPTTVEQAVYLDVDGLVCGDLTPLFQEELPLISGVLDTLELHHRTAIGLTAEDAYINTGVLRINLKRWRKEGVTQRCLDYIAQQNGYVPHMDQQVINAVLKGQITILPPEWNVLTPVLLFSPKRLKRFYKLKNYYSPSQLRLAAKEPKFIHYTQSLVGRPWVKDSQHPRQADYWESRSLTGYPLERQKDTRSRNLRRLEKIYRHFGQTGYFAVVRLIDLLKGGTSYS